ncbi:MAG: D-alanyl-D-alanine carboxypeptidase/D-alanyl-D-alanine-endopeptidase [Ramlibacter sp.]|nr:D-alanyl-D-alanine carboxypeptidase/D-alanyl-D-alanine-endopeptidase [Ramlibacter sp.]
MFLRPAAVFLCLALAALELAAQSFPPEIEAALNRSKLPRDAIALLVVDADGKSPPRLSHRPTQPMNPASVAKLTTTYAGLDLLGPAFTWSTPVYVEGTVRDGTLYGNLYIKGQGDPKLVVENLWLLMRRVQGLGIRAINGDIVLDRTAFEVPAQDPGAFDGEPLRPYNASPDALLINFKSLMMTFTPRDGQALVHVEPPLAGVQLPANAALAKGDCGDWRAGLRADFSDASRVRFAGAYPANCGERLWPIASGDPSGYAARAVAGMWQQLGGTLTGRARDGRVPATLAPAFEVSSPALSELVRDINKFSNNVMAQQVFLTLSLKRRGTGTFAGSREIVRQWWRERIGGEPPTMDNGSGLSRDERISAQQLASLLQSAWASPVMPELMSSLPVSGVDGTMKRTRSKAAGVAHLKTGSLRDVSAVAGYVHAASGKRYVLVAIANHAQAGNLRPVIETLIEWTAADQ